MFVSFRKCSRHQKPDPISDRNCQNLYPISDQNGSKTIPFGAAHTYIPYIGEYPPPGGVFCMRSVNAKVLYVHNVRILDQPFSLEPIWNPPPPPPRNPDYAPEIAVLSSRLTDRFPSSAHWPFFDANLCFKEN